MAKEASFDVVSEIDMQEIDNAVNQTEREVATRYDLKGSHSTIALDKTKGTIDLAAADDFHLRAVVDVLQSKMVKRGISLKALAYGKVEPASSGTVRQTITLVRGIDQERARSLAKLVRDSKLQARPQIEGEKLRVFSKKKDILQDVIRLLKEADIPIPLQFTNYRDSSRHRVALVTLGCPKNEADSARLVTLLGQAFDLVEDPRAADAVVVNTCGFIESAARESLDAVIELAGLETSPLVAAVGCLASRYGDELARALPEAALTVGLDRLHHLPGILIDALDADGVGEDAKSAPPRLWDVEPAGTGPTAYLSVSDGCDRACSYCTIPSFRGRHTSRPPADIQRDAEAMVSGGARELVLVGQDTGSYGRDLGADASGPWTLARVVRRLARALGADAWLRIMYLQPDGVTGELLEAMGESPSVVPYLDVPIQHSDPAVLRAMGRSGGEAEVRAMVGRIRAALGEPMLRTTVICGFPGESAAAFASLERLVAGGLFDYVGAFAYSREAGTRAAAMPGQVRADVRERRRQRLVAAAARAWDQRATRFLGRTLDVLVEGPSDDPGWAWMGRFAGQAPEIDGAVYWSGQAGAPFVPVRVEAVEGYDLLGRGAR